MKLQDSGERREFNTGAVRDVAEGKGRCDLMPLVNIGKLMHDEILIGIGHYVHVGDESYVENALKRFIHLVYPTVYEAMLEVAKHYEDGAVKYSPRNWEKGINLSVYVDSGIRHYFKFMRGDNDEPHGRAFVWNMLGLLWTHENRPEMNDLPFGEVKSELIPTKI